MKLARRIFVSIGLAAACLAGAVALWYGIIHALGLQPYILPTPKAVAMALGAQYRVLLGYLAATLGSGLAGICISTVLAFACAAAFASNPRLADTFMPFMVAVKNAPVVALAPLVMLFLGRGLATSVVVVMVVSFLPMLVNCLQGFQAANRRHLELMHVYAARADQVFWKVRFPFALPYVFAGLRTAVPAAVLGALLAEWLTGAKGIGSFILETASMRDMDVLWAGIVVCMGASMALFWLTVLAERFVQRRIPAA
ncbi:ABC transporter permease [Pigmentiphaga soli]|uniref:ABC transporter permease n=1 Tax=Pigmentiphaga soli TaxID=1007095 RepID=A0ABP8HDZ2_9BURK